MRSQLVVLMVLMCTNGGAIDDIAGKRERGKEREIEGEGEIDI